MRRRPRRERPRAWLLVRRCAAPGKLRRKPRGIIGRQVPGYDQRYSFCCAQDGCRKRTTPASLRFLGPKVYLGAVVTLMSAVRGGLNERRASELQHLVGVSHRTLERWRAWWQEVFAATAFFRVVRASISGVSVARLPASLLEHFEPGDALTRLVRLLDFIKPVTTRSEGSSAMLG